MLGSSLCTQTLGSSLICQCSAAQPGADPPNLPPLKELWVAGPPTAVMDESPIKRLLSYPVDISDSAVVQPRELGSSAGHHSDEEGMDCSRRWRHFCTPPPPPPPSNARRSVTSAWGLAPPAYNGWEKLRQRVSGSKPPPQSPRCGKRNKLLLTSLSFPRTAYRWRHLRWCGLRGLMSCRRQRKFE